MGNMPEAIAYFSAVDVDSVMRYKQKKDYLTH